MEAFDQFYLFNCYNLNAISKVSSVSFLSFPLFFLLLLLCVVDYFLHTSFCEIMLFVLLKVVTCYKVQDVVSMALISLLCWLFRDYYSHYNLEISYSALSSIFILLLVTEWWFHVLRWHYPFLPAGAVLFFDSVTRLWLQCTMKETESLEDLIGCKIKVWWPMDKQWVPFLVETRDLYCIIQ